MSASRAESPRPCYQSAAEPLWPDLRLIPHNGSIGIGIIKIIKSGAEMRSRNAVALGVLGLTIAGCGPAEIVPMTPPGVAYRRVLSEGMDAEGEQRNRAAIRPKK